MPQVPDVACTLRGALLQVEAQAYNIHNRSTYRADRLREVISDRWRYWTQYNLLQNGYYSAQHAFAVSAEYTRLGLAPDPITEYCAAWFTQNSSHPYRERWGWEMYEEWQGVRDRFEDWLSPDEADPPSARQWEWSDGPGVPPTDPAPGMGWTPRPVVPARTDLIPLPDRYSSHTDNPAGSWWDRRSVLRIPTGMVPFQAEYTPRGRYSYRTVRAWDGALWHVHEEYRGEYDERNQYMLPPGFFGTNCSEAIRSDGQGQIMSVQHAQPIGPSVRECGNRCLYSDGCSACNPDVYSVCPWSCRGLERYRRPVDRIDCECWMTCAVCTRRDAATAFYRQVRYEDTTADVCGNHHLEHCDRCGYYVAGAYECPHMHRCVVCDEGGRNGRLRSYSYKPDPNFLGEGPMFFGLELEVDTGSTELDSSEIARHANNALNIRNDVAYLKSDGSVNGFEVVTHPMSFEYAMQEFPHDVWEELAEMGGRAPEGCGIHVHVSRDGFSGPVALYRWLKFFHRNRRQVERLARRSGSNWARFDPSQRTWAIHAAKAGADAVNSDSVIRHVGYQGYRSIYEYDKWYAPEEKVRRLGHPAEALSPRYSAINLQNEHTLEVRVFRSSLDPVQVRGAIQLIHASIMYAEQLTVPIIRSGGWGWPAFTSWVADRPEYGDLYSEINRIGV